LAVSGSKRALAVALLGCLLFGAAFALPHRGGDRETFPAAIGVRHSAGIEAPRAPQTRVASYLVYSFAGEITASGEPFDPEGYTAAHRTLPFGTRLLVSYGGRSVRVTVNDRCPYTAGLDLSLAAAREIGLTDPGIAAVRGAVAPRTPKMVGYKQGQKTRMRRPLVRGRQRGER
jgi:rare lipoprotein A (peptidoglycan hydrolase)